MRVFLLSVFLVLTLVLVPVGSFAGKGASDSDPQGIYSAEATKALDAGITAYEAEDYKKALELWMPLAEAEDYRAIYWIGNLYRHGRGVGQSFETALTHYQKVLDQDHDGDSVRRTQYALGYALQYGQGRAKDADLAECFYRASAENGYANAQYVMNGIIFESRPPLHPEQFIWMDRALKQGHALSLNRRGSTYILNPYEDIVKGFLYIHLAADKGVIFAQEVLEGFKVENDPKHMKEMQEGRKLADDWEPIIEPIPSPPKPIPALCWQKLIVEVQ